MPGYNLESLNFEHANMSHNILIVAICPETAFSWRFKAFKILKLYSHFISTSMSNSFNTFFIHIDFLFV